MMGNTTLDLRRRRMALQVAFALVGALAMGAFALSANASAANKKLRVAYTAIPNHVTVLVAQEQGFFKKNGLDVTLTPTVGSQVSVPALGKQFDVSNSSVEALLSLQTKGFGPMLLAGNDFQTKARQQTFLYTKKGITSWKQLKGKRIGVVAVGTGGLWAGAVIAMNKAGLKKSDITFVPVPFANMVDQMKAGRIDAAIAVDPFAGQLKAAGFGNFTNPLLAVTSPSIGSLWIAKAAAVKKDPKKFKAFYKSLNQAIAWIRANPAGWRASVVKNLKLPLFVANRLDLAPLLKAKVDPKTVQAWVKPLEKAGLLKKGKIKNVKPLIMKP